MNLIKRHKGITLIALIITIIILLILAGVTIAMVVGDNGILKRSNEAKDETTIAKIQEEVDLAVADLVIEYQTRNHVTSNSNSDDQVKAMDEILVAVNESDVTPSPILDEENDEEPGLNSGSESDVTNPSLISGSESDYISDGSDENITPGTAGAYVAEQKARLESKLGYEISFTGRKITVVDSGSGLDTSGVMEDSGHIVWNGRYVAGSGANSSSGGNGTSGNSSGSGDGSSSGGSSSQIVGIHPETYGKYVDIGVDINGDSNTTNDFRVFLNDGSNVYLIAADYIPNSMCPKSNQTTADNGTHSLNTNGSYKAYFTNILGDYNGATDISGNSLLNSNYNKWANRTNLGAYASKSNAKAVAYMLDTTAWGVKFKNSSNSSYINYVTGGPTLEQFAASYNAKHAEDTNFETAVKMNYDENNNTGYKVSRGSNALNTYDSGFSTADDSLYFYNKSGRPADYMWLASPSASSEDSVMRASYSGIVGYYGYGNDNSSYNKIAFRPLVSLKSGVSLVDSDSDRVFDFN